MVELYIEAVEQSEVRIEVDGDVEPDDAIAGHPQIEDFYSNSDSPSWIEYSEDTVHELGAATTWHYEGDITAFDVNGSVNVQVEGEDTTPAQLVAHYNHYPMDRVVVWADEGQTAAYDLTIDGTIREGAGFDGSMGSSEASDETGQGGWSDFYFDGDITEFNLDGQATCNLNCEEVQPDDLVTTPYEPPEAAFSTEKDYLTVEFDASASESGTAALDSYEWDISGTGYSGETASHTFTSEGTYDISLTVTDVEGGTDTAEDTVTVSAREEPPTAEFSHTTDGLTVSVDASDSSAGSSPIDEYEWTIDSRVFSGETVSHTFESAGTYTVRLSVYDENGLDDTTSKSVEVEEGSGGGGIGSAAPLLAGIVGVALISEDSDVLSSIRDDFEDNNLSAAFEKIEDASDDDVTEL